MSGGNEDYVPAPYGTTNLVFKCLFYELLFPTIDMNNKIEGKLSEDVSGGNEDYVPAPHGTTNLVFKCLFCEKLFPAIDANDYVPKSTRDNVCGCRHSLLEGIMHATDVMSRGKRATANGFDEVAEGCASALRGASARMLYTEI
eukprot:10206691-Heterocapsa_arctica.AAC.1